MGIADIILYVQVERYTGFGPVISLISGILSVMSGMMLLVYPRAGALVLTLLFPIWFIAHCISRLAHLPHIRLVAGSGMYTLSLVIQIVGLILGIMMFLRPLFTLATIRCFGGCYLILLGIDSILLAVSPGGDAALMLPIQPGDRPRRASISGEGRVCTAVFAEACRSQPPAGRHLDASLNSGRPSCAIQIHHFQGFSEF